MTDRCGQQGWIAVTTLVWAGAVFGVILMVLSATADVLVTQARAQTAADAAALAAASTSPLVGGKGTGVREAERLAERNGAELALCRCEAIDAAEVVVTVRTRIASVRRFLPEIRARARAELLPRGARNPPARR